MDSLGMKDVFLILKPDQFPVYINFDTAIRRNDMKAFKMEVSAGKGDGVLRVGHGDTVTVRVPTHEGGSCLYWEFATDSHDIGFGVYFEWGKPTTTEVSVHISESDEEEEDPGEEGDGEWMDGG